MRTLQQIDQDYTQYATLYGDRVFKISHLQAEVKELHDKMLTLNKEKGEAQMAHLAEAKRKADIETEFAKQRKLMQEIEAPKTEEKAS